MDTLFPWGFPGPTALYLTLYLLTLVVHMVLMSYVLAGSGYAAVAAVVGKPDPAARTLNDWLPFALGIAITAGVAPLLFVQILYKETFYTANLLLYYRWVAVVPVLIVGFYLLYLAKARVARDWPRLARSAVMAAAFGCFAFTAWSWTGNHLLSLERPVWAEFYASGDMGTFLATSGAAMCYRLATWATGAAPLMALIVGWQLYRRDEHGGGAITRLALVAVSGLVASAICAIAYVRVVDAEVGAVVTGPLARPYLIAAGIGAVVQIVSWAWHLRSQRWSRGLLAATAIGAALVALGTAVGREAVRLAHIDITLLSPVHAQAASTDGMLWFFLFLAINAGVITWCLRSARRSLSA